MIPTHFLMGLSVATLAMNFFHPNLGSTISFVISVTSFVVAGILVPFKDTPTKEDMQKVVKVLNEFEEKQKHESGEFKKVIEDLGGQIKANATRLTGLRMKLGFQD